MNRMRIVIFLIISSIAFGCLAPGCGSGDKDALAGDKTDYYITFTVTHGTYEERNLESDVYYYNPGSRELKKVAVVPYNAQYPLTVYDKKRDIVFYSAKAASGVGDQLYAYDYKKGEQTQLTDNIFAINHIIPLDNGILLGQVPFGSPDIAINPYLYDDEKRELINWTWEQDYHFNNMFYNISSGLIIGSAYSASEDNRRLANQDEEDYVECDNHVFIIDDKGGKELFMIENNDILNLISVKDKIIYGYNKSGFLTYDIKTGEQGFYNPEIIEKLHEKQGNKAWTFLYITDDENDFFVLGSKDGGTCLYHYNKPNDELIDIYTADISREQLNNAIVLPEK